MWARLLDVKYKGEKGKYQLAADMRGKADTASARTPRCCIDRSLLCSVNEFHELRGLGSDGLLYVKEDLLIPHHYTFYDLIASKACGKSGPLFHFDVHSALLAAPIAAQHERRERERSSASKSAEAKRRVLALAMAERVQSFL